MNTYCCMGMLGWGCNDLTQQSDLVSLFYFTHEIKGYSGCPVQASAIDENSLLLKEDALYIFLLLYIIEALLQC